MMNKESTNLLQDRVVGIVAAVLGVVLMLFTFRLGIGTFKLPGAGAWPFLLSICLFLLGSWLFFHPDASNQAVVAQHPRWGKFALALVTIFAYALLLSPLGYLVGTFLLLLVQVHWVEGHNWRVSLTTALIGAVVSFAVFGFWLKVPLPSGVIPIRVG